MTERKISVIIPVYNVENYLRECVESIMIQSYENIEIILVDDGSTDRSGLICDELSAEDARVKVLHKENGGLSSARNCGLDNATGDYVCFVDSDDFVANDYIGSMYKNLRLNKVEIAACGYCRYYDNGKVDEINYGGIDRAFLGDEAQKYLNLFGYFNVSACNKLFNKSLFADIRFPEGKKSEDWFVMYKLIDNAGGIYYCSDIKYFYRQRPGSITKSQNINQDCIEAAKEVYEYYINENRLDVIPYGAQAYAFACIGVYNMFLINKKDNERMKFLRNTVRGLKKSLTFSELEKKRKIQLFLFLNSKFMYDIAFGMFDNRRKNKYYK